METMRDARLLTFCGPHGLTDFTKNGGAFHAVLGFNLPGVGDHEFLALGTDLDCELDLTAFHGARQRRLTKLTLVITGQLLTFLFKRESRSSGALRGFHSKRPLAGYVYVRLCSSACYKHE